MVVRAIKTYIDDKIRLTWWHTPLFPALGRQRQVDLGEVKASLGETQVSHNNNKNLKK